jgi:hypothetical protein
MKLTIIGYGTDEPCIEIIPSNLDDSWSIIDLINSCVVAKVEYTVKSSIGCSRVKCLRIPIKITREKPEKEED